MGKGNAFPSLIIEGFIEACTNPRVPGTISCFPR